MAENEEFNFSEILKLEKKKKPKRQPFALQTSDQENKMATDEIPSSDQVEPIKSKDMESDDIDTMFEGKKKRRSRKPRLDIPDEDEKSKDNDNADDGDNSNMADGELDYEYSFMLCRVYGRLKEEYPHLIPDKKKIFKVPRLIVYLDGSRRSTFVNFLDICNRLHRQPKHVLDFVLSELATSGSFDSCNKLTLKGRFRERNVQTVMESYIKEYVLCKQCKSADTFLAKEIRLVFLRCESCGARQSVAPIKTGYRAVTCHRR